jgi:Zn-dependent M28 family amino/carboxypeptidase
MTEIMTTQDAQYAFDIVKTICAKVGPGLAGSSQERERADILKKELESHLDARLLNFEMIAYPDSGILTSDANGILKNPLGMVKGAVAAAQRAGVPHKVMSGTIGVNTDAVPFNKAGLKALTLIPFKFPQQTVAFYHTYRD